MATNRQQNLDKVGQAVKNWNANPVRPVYISPNDRRAPGATTNATATPQMQPSVQPRMLTGEQMAPLNQKFANKGIFAGDPSTVPFSDVTEDARRFAQTDMRTPTQKMAARPPTPATPQDKAAVLLNMYRENLMPQPALTLGGATPPKAPNDAKSFLNTPSYDMDYGTIQELQKTRDGKIVLADIQERQKRFTQSITAIATQMGLGEIGRSDEGMQEFYERAIYGNPEYSPLIAGFAKGMFMKTMPTNIRRQMEREKFEERKQIEIQKKNQWAEQSGQKYRWNEFGEKYDLQEEPAPEPTIAETVARQKQAAEEELAARQQAWPDQKFKVDPLTGKVILDEPKPGQAGNASADTFKGSDLFNSLVDTYEKNKVRNNIARLEYGEVIDEEGNLVEVSEIAAGYIPENATEEQIAKAKRESAAKVTEAMERRRQYLKKWKGEVTGEVERLRGVQDTEQPSTANDFETAKSIFAQNYEALAADNAIEEIPIEGRPNWVRVRFPDPVTGRFHEFIVEKNI